MVCQVHYFGRSVGQVHYLKICPIQLSTGGNDGSGPGFPSSLLGDVPNCDICSAGDADLLQRLVQSLDALEVQLSSQSLLLQTFQESVEETLLEGFRLDFISSAVIDGEKLEEVFASVGECECVFVVDLLDCFNEVFPLCLRPRIELHVQLSAKVSETVARENAHDLPSLLLLFFFLNGVYDDLFPSDLIQKRIFGVDRQEVFEPGVESHRWREHLEQSFILVFVHGRRKRWSC